MRDFRFSCNVFAIRSREAFARYCQDAERYGYDTVFTTDHLGSPAPSRRWCWPPRLPNGSGWESSC